MSIKDYFRSNLGEWFFCLAGAVCCSVCLAEGFFIPDEWLGRVLPALIPCILSMIYLSAAAHSRRSAAVGAGAAVIGIILFVILMLQGSETVRSGGLYVFLCAAVTSGVFLLSRTRAGSAVAVLLAGFILCGNSFMSYGEHPVLLLTGMCALGALYLVRRYQITVRNVSARRVSGRRMALSAAAFCLTAAMLSSAVALFVLAPLHLPTFKVKLVTELSALSVVEKLGISSMVPLMDPERTAEGEQEPIITGEEGEAESGQPVPDEQNLPGESGAPSISGGPEHTGSVFHAEAVRYEMRSILTVLIPALILIGLAALFGGKRYLRKRRQEKLLAMPEKERIEAIYQYILAMFSRMKLPPAASETPQEYCERIGERLDDCLGGRGRLRELSGLFMKVSYGGEKLQEEEAGLSENIYRHFPERLRKKTGLPGYLRYYFFT